MEATQDLSERRIADAWADLQAHANNGNPLAADAYRMAFADPEFLLRRETRGILRLQLPTDFTGLGHCHWWRICWNKSSSSALGSFRWL